MKVEQIVKDDMDRFVTEMTKAKVEVTRKELEEQFIKLYPEDIIMGEAIHPKNPAQAQMYVLGCVKAPYYLKVQRNQGQPELMKMFVIDKRDADPLASGKVISESLHCLYLPPTLSDHFEFGELTFSKKDKRATEEKNALKRKLYEGVAVGKAYELEMSAFRGREGYIKVMPTDNTLSTLKPLENIEIPKPKIVAALIAAFPMATLQEILDKPRDYIGHKRTVVGEVIRGNRGINPKGNRYGFLNIVDNSLRELQNWLQRGGISLQTSFSQVRMSEGRIATVCMARAEVNNGVVNGDKLGMLTTTDFSVDGMVVDVKTDKVYVDEPDDKDPASVSKGEIVGGKVGAEDTPPPPPNAPVTFDD